MYFQKNYNEFYINNTSIILREDLASDLFITSILQLISNSFSEKWTPITGGRDNIFLLEIDGNFPVSLKLYSHGGIFKYLFPKYFFFTNRFLHEFHLYRDILKNELPIPEYLGGFWRKERGFYKCGVITRYISDTITLEIFLNDVLTPIEDKYHILIKSGKAIKKMHDLGIFHYDLQIRNILVHKQSKSIYLIDFDKAKRMPPLNLFCRSLNLMRLKRSFIKRDITIDFFAHLVKGYGIPHLSFSAQLLSYPHIQWLHLKKTIFKNQKKHNKNTK